MDEEVQTNGFGKERIGWRIKCLKDDRINCKAKSGTFKTRKYIHNQSSLTPESREYRTSSLKCSMQHTFFCCLIQHCTRYQVVPGIARTDQKNEIAKFMWTMDLLVGRKLAVLLNIIYVRVICYLKEMTTSKNLLA